MKLTLIVLIALLLIFHQDNWYWNDGRLVWGFMPIGLFYHAGISLAAALVWLLTAIFLCPKEIDATGDAPPRTDASEGAE